MWLVFILAWIALIVIDAAGWVLLPTLVIALPLIVAAVMFVLGLLFVGGIVALFTRFDR